MHIGAPYTRQALAKLVKAGRMSECVVRGADGAVEGLDPDLLLDEYDRKVDVTKRRGHLTIAVPSGGNGRLLEESPPTRESLKKSVALLPDDQVPDLQTSRERREHYQAELAKLAVDEKRGELVAVEAVKKEAYASGRVVRDALLNIPDRVAHQLAGEVDPAAIHQMLSQEIVQALEGLANG